MPRRKKKETENAVEADGPPVLRNSYSIRLLIEANGVCVFEKWFNALRDRAAKQRILARVARIVRDGNFGDHRERISGAVSELRVDYGPGYRVYYAQTGNVIVVLLGGGTKERQQDDIEATTLWEGNKDADERFSRVFGG